jgi:hypothetical protein
MTVHQVSSRVAMVISRYLVVGIWYLHRLTSEHFVTIHWKPVKQTKYQLPNTEHHLYFTVG